jgi:hypothetical protein
MFFLSAISYLFQLVVLAVRSCDIQLLLTPGDSLIRTVTGFRLVRVVLTSTLALTATDASSILKMTSLKSATIHQQSMMK